MSDAVRLDEILEAVLLAAGEPLSVERLSQLLDDDERRERRELREALEALAMRLENTALELIETASGYQLRIRQRLSPWVSRLWDERPQRYSRASLETLALIAYRQPVTRGDIEEVRGVAVSSSIMRTLSERGWIRVVGHRDVPGRPAVYATTRQFLDDFGLKTLDALPPIHELKSFDMPGDDLHEQPGSLQTQVVEHEQAPDASELTTLEEDQGSTPIATHESIAGRADAPTHAGTASTRSGLSFADLEARLAERILHQSSHASESSEDGLADAENSTEENSFDR